MSPEAQATVWARGDRGDGHSDGGREGGEKGDRETGKVTSVLVLGWLDTRGRGRHRMALGLGDGKRI